MGSSSTSPRREIRWRYAFLAVGFAALTAYRLGDGDLVWAAVFALAVLANVCLAVGLVPGVVRTNDGAYASRTAEPEAEQDQKERSPTPDEELMQRTLTAYSSRMRSWGMVSLGGLALVVAGALTFPPLGLAASVLFLVAALRYLRFRRSVLTLRGALDRTDEGGVR